MNELTKRILTASILVPLVLFLIFKSQIGFLILVGIGGVIVGYEFTKLSKMKPLLLWLVMALIFIVPHALTNIFHISHYSITMYLLPLLYLSTAFWFKNLFLVFNYPNKKPKNTELRKATNLFLLITPLTFLPILQTQSVAIILLLLFIVWGADSFAYFTGKAFGKHKLAPNLSGGKTIEGVVGGLIGVLLITGIWMFVTENTNYGFLLLALITGIFSVIGDLYESIYKREAGVKDSGNILPGHGGMFDRLDGLLAATPIFSIVLIALNL
ncbi:Phosphatidate cytidylyltransferase (EC [Bathymodiolus thermophilus thioautotrophic gill symbiont]|uniref:Phosphatidate cytidylyltransferase n=1 Tax=Bathymodiolus thermophilus thioautotrophic gill symbiont TaxID=2360 RepID=A0A1J5UA06_9GAMM|nr:phosphatidate cytidylyltransferase [Bathymodiolus thermophilus thioautotrophic gill symbiont]OIR25193.1 hypothetical protein BGC33_12820 [Bathymodiolus thermophilus thioautotrophic gill symbiont]CAB5497217.1 Phosphatidate cytidylyltransferase (EC [Bathymodiolus thermophilus thioautotrophic gill symbiont]